jgi:hypothetical protein
MSQNSKSICNSVPTKRILRKVPGTNSQEKIMLHEKRQYCIDVVPECRLFCCISCWSPAGRCDHAGPPGHLYIINKKVNCLGLSLPIYEWQNLI